MAFTALLTIVAALLLSTACGPQPFSEKKLTAKERRLLAELNERSLFEEEMRRLKNRGNGDDMSAFIGKLMAEEFQKLSLKYTADEKYDINWRCRRIIGLNRPLAGDIIHDMGRRCIQDMESLYPQAWKDLNQKCGTDIVGCGGPKVAIYDAFWNVYPAKRQLLADLRSGEQEKREKEEHQEYLDTLRERRSPYSFVWTGFWFLSQSGIVGVNDGFGLAAAILISWWTWVTVLRLALVIPARWLGLYNPDHFWLGSLLWPWRPLYDLVGKRFARKRREWFEHGKGANARWASRLETMALLYRPGGALTGRLSVFGFGLFQPVGWFLERHVVLLGATAAGKTRWLITLLGLARGNVLVIDVAAQMVNVIGRRLGGGGRGILGMNRDVHTFDPYGKAHGRKTSRWNVFREMDRFVKEHGPQTEVEFSQKLAEALIRPEKNPENAWVTSEAQGFVAGLVLYMRRKYAHEPEKLTLIQMRSLIAVGLDARQNNRKGERVDGFRMLLDEMKAMGGTIATAAGVMESSMRADGGSPPRGSCLDLMKWLDLDQMQAIVGGDSDFDLHDLKLGKVCLFICAPVDDVRGTLSGFFRLVTLLTMNIYRRLDTTKVHLKNPTLLVMDEMPALGNIDGMEDVAPEMRKHGMKLVCVAQELEGLQKTYPSSWRTFLSNSDAMVYMSLGDPMTIDHLGEELGSRKRRGWISFKTKDENELLTRQQIKDFLHPAAENVIVVRYGRPLKLKNAIYYKELPVYAYDADPRYNEPLGRRWGRRICQHLIAGPELAWSEPIERENIGAVDEPKQPYQYPPKPMPPEESRQDHRPAAAEPPQALASTSGSQDYERSEAVNPDFLRVLRECFHSTDGEYPRPQIRRVIWEEFRPTLTDGQNFDGLQLRFEDWVAFRFRKEKARADHVVTFLGEWIEQVEKGREDAN